jgi:hypothetical protein
MLMPALNKIVKSLTNNELEVESGYYGGEQGQRCLTNGYLIRRTNFRNGEPTKVELCWKECTEALSCLDAIGFYADMQNNRIVIEPWWYFYTDDVILTCLDIAKVERSIDNDRCFNILNIGYDKWTAEGWNGIDGFHGKRQYAAAIKYANAKIEKYCKWIADNYAIETTRRVGITEPSNDWKYDNNIFIIDLNSDGSVNLGNSNEDNTTLYRPDIIYNVELSPVRMAMRWFHWITQACRQDKVLKITASEGYAGAKTRSTKNSIFTSDGAWVIENENIQENDNDGNQILLPHFKVKPELIKFKYPLLLSDFNRIRQSPHGKIGYQIMGSAVEYGYIKEIEYDICIGMANFTLIAAV